MAHAQAQPLEYIEPTRTGAPKLGMWLFLSGEVVLFGGVIMTIVLFRAVSYTHLTLPTKA